MTPPNILLITADQFRADSMSAAGHPLVKTPHLDRLAEDGVRFAQHYSQCPPCGPSRTSLLTGMYQMNHRSVQNGTPLDGAFTNLAELVRTARYTPWLIGYTDTTLDPRRLHPNDPRAGRYEELLPGIQQFAPGSEECSADPAWWAQLRELGYDCWNDPFRQKPDYAAAAQAKGPDLCPHDRQGRAWSDRLHRGPGSALLPPICGRAVVPASELPAAASALCRRRALSRSLSPGRCAGFPSVCRRGRKRARSHPFMPFRLERLEMNPKLPLDISHPNDSPAWRQARATYYGLITELDHHIGRLVAALKQLGAYDDTLIVFTSDHAEMLGDHWCWGKETPFDAAVRVPMIVKSPLVTQSARGGVVDAFTEHVDVTPTILDHIGVEVPLQCDGRSLRPFLEGGQPAKWRDAAHWEFDFRNINDESVDGRFGISIDECCLAVVRTTKQKYVHFAGLPPLYYDIADDPAELSEPLRPAGPRRGRARHGAPHAELAHGLQPAGADRHPPAGRHADPRGAQPENRLSDRQEDDRLRQREHRRKRSLLRSNLRGCHGSGHKSEI